MQEGRVKEIVSQVSRGCPWVSPLGSGVGGIPALAHFPGSARRSMAVGAFPLAAPV